MSPTPAAWTTAAAATLRQEQKMTRPSPLQVLDADMPKWAAGGWKPGDAAGILAALEEAGYVVVDRADLAVIRKALGIGFVSWDGDGWYASKDHLGEEGHSYDEASAAFSEAFSVLDRLAERSEAAEEVERDA